MVELRLKKEDDHCLVSWEPVCRMSTRKMQHYLFETFDYRIDRVVYTEETPKFLIDAKKAHLWAKIRGEDD